MYCETKQYERQFQTILYYRKPQDGIAMSKNRWLWCPCMYLLLFDPIRFFLNCDIHVKYVIKISAIYNIIIVHIPVQNFTCIITFIVHHQKFSVFCIFTLPVHALFLLLFFTCNEMSKVHKICLYLINKHSCYIGILFVLQ